MFKTKYVFWLLLQFLFEKFPNLRRIQRGTFIHVHKFSCRAPLFSMDVNTAWNYFLENISEIYSKTLKICPVGVELLHASGGKTEGRRERQSWRS